MKKFLSISSLAPHEISSSRKSSDNSEEKLFLTQTFTTTAAADCLYWSAWLNSLSLLCLVMSNNTAEVVEEDVGETLLVKLFASECLSSLTQGMKHDDFFYKLI